MSIPFFSDIDLKNNKIINAGNPENDKDLINKSYLDTIINTTQTTLNNNILIAKDEMTAYIDTQITDINTNMTNNVTQILLDNIIDNITSSDNSKALSANMGHYLSTLIDDTNNSIATLLESINVYSTTVTEIGKYINGTLNGPLYRILYEIEVGPQSSQEIQVDLSDIVPNTCKIFKVYGTYELDNNTTSDDDTITTSLYFIEYGKNETKTSGVYLDNFNNASKILNIYVGSETITKLDNKTISLVIEYYNDTVSE